MPSNLQPPPPKLATRATWEGSGQRQESPISTQVSRCIDFPSTRSKESGPGKKVASPMELLEAASALRVLAT